MNRIEKRKKMKEFYFLKKTADVYSNALRNNPHLIVFESIKFCLFHEYKSTPASIFKTYKPQKDKRRIKRLQRKHIEKFKSIKTVSINDNLSIKIDIERLINDLKNSLKIDSDIEVI